jgi:hypothetical protein
VQEHTEEEEQLQVKNVLQTKPLLLLLLEWWARENFSTII